MYFNKFDHIYYEFDINGNPVLKVMKDITQNVRFRKKVLAYITAYEYYDIEEGDTPEIIAYKKYGSAEYHWIVMLANERFDYVEDFPLSYHAFELYVKEKYGNDLYDTKHYVNNAGFVVNSDDPEAIEVTNYDYEYNLNESKRRIKIISPALLETVLRNFKELI